jgi:hypothetical protein
MARAVGVVSRLSVKFCSGLGSRRLGRARAVPLAGCARRYFFPTAPAAKCVRSRRFAFDTMPCGHNVSCVRPVREPHPVCATLASHAGGFAAGTDTGRASFSSPEAEHEEVAEFPVDIFECVDAMPASGDVRIVAFRALLPAIRRVAVHAVAGTSTPSPINAERSCCFGLYLIDRDGGEHAFLDFTTAGGATYAAMRIAQVYRLPIEFGSFAEPKSREQ